MPNEKTRYELPGVLVDPLSSARISWQLPPDTCPYLLTWLIVPDDISPHFLVTDIMVGKNSSLCSINCLPASLFATSEPEDELRFNACSPGKYISIDITNTSNSHQPFRCTLVGRHAEDRTRPPKTNKVTLGLGSTKIQPRSVLKLSVESQVEMTPEQLFVPPDLLAKVSIKSVTMNGSAVDQASLTREKLLSHPRTIEILPNKILHCSEILTIEVENETDSPLHFTGAVIGSIPPRKPRHTADLFSKHVPAWLEHIVPRLQGRPGTRWLEVGSFEGQSALWTLSNVLTGENSWITCVDVFDGYAPGIELWGGGNRQYELTFDVNLDEYSNVTKLVGRALNVLPHVKAAGLKFDGGYLDVGIDRSSDELDLMWELMDPGAVVVVGNYGSPPCCPLPQNPYSTFEVLHDGTCLILLKSK